MGGVVDDDMANIIVAQLHYLDAIDPTKMMEDAVHFLSKETVVQAIARSATKLQDCPSSLRCGRPFLYKSSTDVGCRREMCAHARILALEEAIDTEWVYMWDKFGGYVLLLLGLTAKVESVQDEVRLRLFLDSIGYSDISAKKIKKWIPEDRRQFELIQESYIREKKMEEKILMQRREEEGKGKEIRKALLEKEERKRKWKEIEASLMSSIPNVGSRDAAAMAADVRALGGDSVMDDSFARERVSSIARHIHIAQLVRHALQYAAVEYQNPIELAE